MKIRVVIPFATEYEDCKPLIKEMEACREHEFIIDAIQGCYVDNSRNQGVSTRRDNRVKQTPSEFHDIVLQLDSDITATLDDILDLIQPIIDGFCEVTCAPYKCHDLQVKDSLQCGIWENLNVGIVGEKYPLTALNTGLKQVDWCGAGCLAIKSTVFDTLDFPWFDRPMIDQDDKRVRVVEDIGFCMTLTTKEIPLWCNFDITIKHRERTKESFNWHNTPKSSFNLDPNDVKVILVGLHEIVAKFANPVIDKIKKQVKENSL